jgi:hypothetical protein
MTQNLATRNLIRLVVLSTVAIPMLLCQSQRSEAIPINSLLEKIFTTSPSSSSSSNQQQKTDNSSQQNGSQSQQQNNSSQPQQQQQVQPPVPRQHPSRPNPRPPVR